MTGARPKDEIGNRYGRLVVLRRSDLQSNGHETRWVCVCDCGGNAEPKGSSLRSGVTKSCGCLHRERLATSCLSHGLSNSRSYGTWGDMIRRCRDENNPQYESYGGRGISVCERWLSSVENFFADMGERPEGMKIDRIDNDGNYEPGNCRWATQATQSFNRRNTLRIEVDGVIMNTAEIVKKYGVPYQVLTRRLRWGWTGDQAAKTPWGVQERRAGRVVSTKPIGNNSPNTGEQSQ